MRCKICNIRHTRWYLRTGGRGLVWLCKGHAKPSVREAWRALGMKV